MTAIALCPYGQAEMYVAAAVHDLVESAPSQSTFGWRLQGFPLFPFRIGYARIGSMPFPLPTATSILSPFAIGRLGTLAFTVPSSGPSRTRRESPPSAQPSVPGTGPRSCRQPQSEDPAL